MRVAAAPTEPTAPTTATVTGTVTYRERIALTPDAVVEARLIDISRADAPAVTIGQQVIENAGQVPIAFEIEYDPADIDEMFTYAIQVSIKEGDKLAFINDTTYLVITRDSPTHVDMILVKVGVTPTEPPEPTMVEVPAPIDGVEVNIAESLPPQYFVAVKSGLPNACYEFDAYDVIRDGDTVRITVTNLKPEQPQMCAEIYRTVESNIALGSDFKGGKTYTVQVNDVTETFVAQPEEPAGPSMITVPAPVQGVEVEVTDSVPPEYSLIVFSTLPKGTACSSFEGYEVTMDETTVSVTVTNLEVAPGQVVPCTADFGYIETEIPLGSNLTAAETYTVVVNEEVTNSFLARDERTSDWVAKASPIETVEVVVSDSEPPQYSLNVVSRLPKGSSCSAFNGYDIASRFAGRIEVTLTHLEVPPGQVVPCTADLPVVSTEIPLGSNLTAAETYTVVVNEEVTETFTARAGSKLLNNADGSLNRLKGIARFDGASNCTGTFIQTSERADAPAYLITNGHCAQRWHANDVYRDEPASDFTATFNYFVETNDAQIPVQARVVVCSTMKGRDVAIVELEATIGDLIGQGVQPFAIADAAPTPAVAIRIFGVPITGIAAEEQYLRREDCSMTGQVDLLEFQWHFFDAFRNTCRDVFGGSSGSPVLAEGSDAIFALINTTSIGGKYACALGVPCEVTETGTQLRSSTSYATPIVGLSRCFDADGRFDLDTPNCPLDDGHQLTLSGHPLQAIQPIVTDDTGATRRAVWGTTLSGDFTHYRYKTGAVSRVDCREEAGYSDPISLEDDDLIGEEIPEAEGFYYLCVIAGNSPTGDETWQRPADPTVVFAQIDTTPPVIAPILFVRESESDYSVQPIFELPELTDYIWKFGQPATTDCSDLAGYRRYRRIALRVDKSNQIPAKVCVIGYDYADNPTPPLERIIGGNTSD